MSGRLVARAFPAVAGALILCGASVRRAAAQQDDPWAYRAPDLTRDQLQKVLSRYEAAAQSTAYSERLRAEAAVRADSIRARLQGGDLREGDRVRLRVEGQVQLSDTFAVGAGPALELPVIGPVPLAGVLRSELTARITTAVDAVYRGAPVRSELLTRIAVIGGVGRPGFYALPPEALVDDAIGAAGGLAPEAHLAGAYVERGRDRLWSTDSLQVAMRQRRTIAALGLQPGDRIVVPIEAPPDPARTAQALTYLLSVPLSLYTLVQLLK
jgi:protein involved in polysaccharide export with SLBB domain